MNPLYNALKKAGIYIIFISLVVFVFALANNSFCYAAGNSIATTESEVTVDVDSTATVYLTGQSGDAVSWESSNTNAVVINSSTSRKAVIFGVGKGTSIITATSADGSTATCKINVRTPAFSIDSSLKAVVEEESTIYVKEGSALYWSSSNNDILRITDYTSSCATVRGESVGTAVLTAVDKYGTESKCTVTVRQERFELYLNDSGVSNYYGNKADFSIYYYSIYHDGWWDMDYNYHESYTENHALESYRIDATGNISSCTSANNSVVRVVKEYDSYYIYPVGIGTTTVTAVNPYGDKETIECSVSLSYFEEKETRNGEGETIKYYSYRDLVYGSGLLQGITYSRAKVVASINGKSYTGYADANGAYRIKVPETIMIGTKIFISTTQYGATLKCTRTVVNNKPGIKLSSVKKSSKKITLTLSNVHKGDYVKIKAGKKTYTRKINKKSAKIKFKIKTKKLKKKQKVTVTVYNQYKQVLAVKQVKVK